jgi:ABC-type sugar transport system ATPase subunit
MNFVRGIVERATLHVGPHRVELPRAVDRSGEVIVGIRPEDFVGANGDGFSARVAFTESLGPETLVHFSSSGLDVVERREQVEAGEEERVRELGDLLVARFGATAPVGDEVRLRIAGERVRLFDPHTGMSLL